MTTFHDNNLWQSAYLAVLEVCDVLGSSEGSSELSRQIHAHALSILTTTADGLTRKDRREHQEKLRNSLGLIAAIRSLLSVAWAQELVTDEQFKKIDSAYEEMAKKIR